MASTPHTMERERVAQELAKPLADELLRSCPLARIGYAGIDGFPRVVTVGFIWNGRRIVTCTAVNAPKVAALSARPRVALSIDTGTAPATLLIRGAAAIEIVGGVPEEFLAASRKAIDPEQWAEFERQVRAMYDRMARISIDPDWAKLIDFETTQPVAIDEILAEKRRANG